MNNYFIVLSLLCSVLTLQGCVGPSGGMQAPGKASNCEAQCDRNATNLVEREECLAMCRQKGTKIVSVDDHSTTFRNGVAVKNPMNERNITASMA
jgi:hypothetical protein